MSIFYNSNKAVISVLLILHSPSPYFSCCFFIFSFHFYIFLYFFTFYLYDVKKPKGVLTVKSKSTLTEIAEKAGVSIATVSRIVNETGRVSPATRQKVYTAIRELEYGSGLKRQMPLYQTILALVPDFYNPFYAGIIEGAQITARAAGNELFLMPTGGSYPNPAALTNLIRREGFSGVLWLCTAPDTELLTMVRQHCPMVMVGEYPEDYPCSYVSIDDVSAAYRAVNYLIAAGCRRIGMINCSVKYKYARHRLQGFRQALEQAGITFHPDWYATVPSIDYTLAYSAAMQLLHTDPAPDAIFASSDVLAAAVINAAHTLGIRVPEDLSVIGFDNVVTSQITQPAITTIAQPCFQLGQQACSILLEKILNPEMPDRHTLLSTEMIIRNSSR